MAGLYYSALNNNLAITSDHSLHFAMRYSKYKLSHEASARSVLQKKLSLKILSIVYCILRFKIEIATISCDASPPMTWTWFFQVFNKIAAQKNSQNVKETAAMESSFEWSCRPRPTTLLKKGSILSVFVTYRFCETFQSSSFKENLWVTDFLTTFPLVYSFFLIPHEFNYQVIREKKLK